MCMHISQVGGLVMDGFLPSKELKPRYRKASAGELPTSSGMLPLSSLLVRSKTWIAAK